MALTPKLDPMLAEERSVDDADDDVRVEDHFVHLRGATWKDHQRVQRLRGDGSVPRLAYLDGVSSS
jgi:hypothetical protein